MDYGEITKNIIEVAKLAGNFIRAERANFDRANVEVKAKNDLVSYVDRGAEKLIIEGLKKIVPDAGFIVEEETETETRELNWIVDPLDGTTNFVHGIPCYCVSIALAGPSEILAAVVLEVSRDECFYTFKGSRSFLNEKEISVSPAETLNDCLVATGFPVNNFDRMQGYLNAVEYFVKNTHGIRRLGSAAADLCYVACGRADVFFEFNLKPWDVAAGALIVKNAGGLVHDFSGGENWLFGKEIIASGKTVHSEFRNVIALSFGL